MVNRQDDLKLSLTRNGSFSVRSTYNVILHLQHQINAQETQERNMELARTLVQKIREAEQA